LRTIFKNTSLVYDGGVRFEFSPTLPYALDHGWSYIRNALRGGTHCSNVVRTLPCAPLDRHSRSMADWPKSVAIPTVSWDFHRIATHTCTIFLALFLGWTHVAKLWRNTRLFSDNFTKTCYLYIYNYFYPVLEAYVSWLYTVSDQWTLSSMVRILCFRYSKGSWIIIIIIIIFTIISNKKMYNFVRYTSN
jgi:hypothetical protein